MNKSIDDEKENKNLEEFLKCTRINEANTYTTYQIPATFMYKI